MNSKELIEKLSQVSPDTEIVGGIWNGKVETYAVLDEFHVFQYDQIYADFYGTPGAFDNKLMQIQSKDVVYLGALFESRNKQVYKDRRVIRCLEKILQMHRSKEWKKERIFKALCEFDFKQ